MNILSFRYAIVSLVMCSLIAFVNIFTLNMELFPLQCVLEWCLRYTIY